MATHGEPRLKLFGRPVLTAGGSPRPLTGERRDQLLVLLALQGDEWTPRDRAAGLLWPDRPTSDARRNLRKVVFRARELPGAEGLQVREDALRWPVESDVADFRAALRDGRKGDAVDAPLAPLCEGFDAGCGREFADWLGGERDALAAQGHRAALERLAGIASPVERATLARRLLTSDPLDEAAVEALLRAELEQGHAGAARAAYRDFAAHLAEAFGIDPSNALRSLVATTGPAAPAGAAAPVASEAVEFVGRRGELAELAALLAAPECRVVTVFGPGGIGKSRLVREALPRLADGFGDGSCWIELQDLVSTAEALGRMAQALGVEITGVRDPLAPVIAWLRERSMLLVFDNAEHLPELGSLVDRVATAGARSRVLVTSRARTFADGEVLLPLGGLERPDEESHDLEAACAFDAVRLFESRARMAQRGFDLGRQLPAVIAIVDAVGGMPLAIELAASWVRLLPPEEIARDLQRSIDLLERDPALSGAPARPEHASMRAVLERSWGLLAPAQRKALAALSVFEGGFTHAAARALADAALPLLSSLVDRSVVGVAEEGRFSLHPLVAAHAAQKLAADPELAAAVRLRHAQFFARRLEALAPQAIGDQRQLVAGVTAEFANCRAAWRHALALPRADLAASMVRALWSFFENRGRLEEGVELLQPGLALPAGATGADLARARLRHGLSMLWHRRGEHDTGRAIADAGIPDGEACGDTEAWVGCVLNAGSCACGRGHFEEALALFERALIIARTRADRHCIGWSLGNIGVAQHALDRLEPARAALEQALAIMRELGDSYNLAVNLFNLGLVMQDQGDLAAARRLLEEGVRHCDGYEIGLIGQYSSLGLAAVLGKQGQADEARRRLRATVAWSRRAGAMPMACNAELALARVELRAGRLEHALAPLQEAGRIAAAMAALPDQMTVLFSFGQWLVDGGDRERGAAVWRLVEREAAFDAWTSNAARERHQALALDAAEATVVEAAPLTLAAALELLAAAVPGWAAAGQRPTG